MSAAAVESNSISPKPLNTIEKAIQDKFKENFKPSKNYTLRFTFEGTDNAIKEYSTNFKFTYSGITNKCITISYTNDNDATDVLSLIESDSNYRQCFSPKLHIEGNLPTGITQTDILQVLNTKLKFIVRAPAEDIALMDSAAVKDPITKATISAPFSNWRVVRGEKPMYAKYGYYSEPFDIISKFAKDNHWSRIELANYKGKTIHDLWIAVYPCVKLEDRATIATVMKQMEDHQSEKSSEIVTAVFNAITNDLYNTGDYGGMFSNVFRMFTLNKESLEWQKWDKLLKIVSFEQVKSDNSSNNEGSSNNSNKGNTTGGSRVRRTRRKYKKVLRKKNKSRSTKRRK